MEKGERPPSSLLTTISSVPCAQLTSSVSDKVRDMPNIENRLHEPGVGGATGAADAATPRTARRTKRLMKARMTRVVEVGMRRKSLEARLLGDEIQ